MHGYFHFSLWILTALAEILFSCLYVVIWAVQNIFVVVGIVFKKAEFQGPSRDAQNVYAQSQSEAVLRFLEMRRTYMRSGNQASFLQ